MQNAGSAASSDIAAALQAAAVGLTASGMAASATPPVRIQPNGMPLPEEAQTLHTIADVLWWLNETDSPTHVALCVAMDCSSDTQCRDLGCLPLQDFQTAISTLAVPNGSGDDDGTRSMSLRERGALLRVARTLIYLCDVSTTAPAPSTVLPSTIALPILLPLPIRTTKLHNTTRQGDDILVNVMPQCEWTQTLS